jgi:anti-anti-sigma factor
MKLSMRPSEDPQTIIVDVAGRFDYTAEALFRNAAERIPADVKQCRIELMAVSHLESAAFGILLLFRELLGPRGIEVTLAGCSQDVYRALRIANFQTFFRIE